MYLVRTATVPRGPDQWPSTSDHGMAAPITGRRERRSAVRKRRPRNNGAKGSSKSRVAGGRDDSMAR